jgi:hypothetical protein
MNIEGAMIEAARRVDEQRRFVTVFRDPYQILGLRDLPDPDEPMSEEVRELFGIIDGTRTVAQVVESASLTEYEAYEAVHQMLESNWIEFVGRRDPGRPQPTGTPAALRRRRGRSSGSRRQDWPFSCRPRHSGCTRVPGSSNRGAPRIPHATSSWPAACRTSKSLWRSTRSNTGTIPRVWRTS